MLNRKTARGWLAALIVPAALTHGAYAADKTGMWYVAPQVGYTITDHVREVDNGAYYGLALGKNVSDAWSFELDLNRGSFHGAAGRKLDLNAVAVDALRVFTRSARVSPYLIGGVGFVNDDPAAGPSRGDLLAEAGFGALVDVARNASGSFQLELRPEVKARWDWNDSGPGRPIDYTAGLSVVFAFGGEHAPRMMSEYEPEPVPQPPAPAATLAVPAVQPAPRPPPARPSSVVRRSGVQFSFNSAQLRSSAQETLDRLAESLERRGRKSIAVEVQGYTDSVGSNAYNLRLSQRRADAAKQYLVMRGVAASRIAARGYGKVRAVASNRTAAGRARNRRVVIVIVSNPDHVQIIDNPEQ